MAVQETKQKLLTAKATIEAITRHRFTPLRFSETTSAVAARAATSVKRYWVFESMAIAVSVPQVFLLWRPVVGAISDVVAFACLVAIALFYERARKLAISAAILPIASIVTLSLPKTTLFTSTTVYYGAILLFALVYLYMFALDAPPKQLTLLGKRYLYYFIFPMIVIGEVLGVIGYLILRHHYMYRGVSLLSLALAAIVFAIAEELLFQGLIQQLASKIMNPRLAAVLAIIAYTAASASRTTVLTAFFAVIAGTTLAIAYLVKPNLVLTTTTNALMKLTYVGLMATFVLH